MRQIAHSHIYHLSFEFSNPERAAWLMRDFLNTSTRKTKQSLTRNLLLKLKNIKVGLDEVEDISEHLIGQQKSGQHSREEKYAIVKDIMKHRLGELSMVSQPIRLILVDWFVFHFCLGCFFGGLFFFVFFRSSSIFLRWSF